MNRQFAPAQDNRQQHDIQSFHEPALQVLDQLIARNRSNLSKKGYDENNAAITKDEFSQVVAHRFRITQWLAQQIVGSLANTGVIESFGGYVKPKAVTA